MNSGIYARQRNQESKQAIHCRFPREELWKPQNQRRFWQNLRMIFRVFFFLKGKQLQSLQNGDCFYLEILLIPGKKNHCLGPRVVQATTYKNSSTYPNTQVLYRTRGPSVIQSLFPGSIPLPPGIMEPGNSQSHGQHSSGPKEMLLPSFSLCL